MRIKSVKRVHLSAPVPVYDVTVDGTQNFQLASGVFVHNSKDVSDAMAGVDYTLTQYAPKLIKAQIQPTVY